MLLICDKYNTHMNIPHTLAKYSSQCHHSICMCTYIYLLETLEEDRTCTCGRGEETETTHLKFVKMKYFPIFAHI